MGRALPELPAGEVIEVSEGGHTGLRVSHHHDLTGLGCMAPDDGHLWVLPDVAGGLPPLGEEEDPVPLERSVGGGGEVQVAVADLNMQTIYFWKVSERIKDFKVDKLTSGYL